MSVGKSTKSINLINPGDGLAMLIDDQRLSRAVNCPRSHLPIILTRPLHHLHLTAPLGLVGPVEIILQQEAVVLQKQDVGYGALPHPKVYRLVGLIVLDVGNGHELFGLPPVPQRNAAVHVVGEHMFAVDAGLGDPVQQTSDPLRPTHPAGVPR